MTTKEGHAMRKMDLELLHRTIQAAEIARNDGFLATHRALIAIARSLYGSPGQAIEITSVPIARIPNEGSQAH